jgi:hypothetical protein
MPQKDYNGSLFRSGCEKANNYPRLVTINTDYVRGRTIIRPLLSLIGSNLSYFSYICVCFLELLLSRLKAQGMA